MPLPIDPDITVGQLDKMIQDSGAQMLTISDKFDDPRIPSTYAIIIVSGVPEAAEVLEAVSILEEHWDESGRKKSSAAAMRDIDETGPPSLDDFTAEDDSAVSDDAWIGMTDGKYH